MNPRDQEMRFTVHDSPDYYQLKVSVFNDDRKTELIGETWVALDQIVVPGGGQNDLWHHLNCKGRFAGEIRIELTYYDTRPKDEKVEEKRPDTQSSGILEPAIREVVSGPRQLKAVKRRPLPADPTGQTSRSTPLDQPQSSPAPYTPPPSNQNPPKVQPQYLEQPGDYLLNTTPPSNTRYEHLQTGEGRGSPRTYNGYGQELYNDDIPVTSMMEQPAVTQYEPYERSNGKENRQANVRERHGLQDEQDFDRPLPYEENDYRVENCHPQAMYNDQYQHTNILRNRPENVIARPPVQPLNDSYNGPPMYSSPSMAEHHSLPDVRPHPASQAADYSNQGSSLSRNMNYETPTRHHSLGSSRELWPSPAQIPVDDEGPPPLPPAHRSGGLILLPRSSDRGHSETYPPISAPAPLNIRPHRGSTSASPLSQVQSSMQSRGYAPSTSPCSSQPFPQSAASVSSHTSYSQPGRRNSQNLLSQSPTKDFSHALPPSLVPGYEPSIADDESQRLLNEKRISTRQSYSNEPSPQYQALPARIPQPRAYPAPRSDTYPPIRSEGQSPLRQLENSQEMRPHHDSTPTAKRGVSPDPRTPMRKSVSPQPELGPGPRRLSAIPFSPDSYDAFNPSASSALNINAAGPKYNTPEQAKEALREREKELRLNDGPIISSNGRVIDPSDHLPADTWAPEPDPKPSRKGPEVTLRFRNSPQGAQPMPPAGTRRDLCDSPSRPQSVSTPIYAHSPDAGSATRNRLLKKSRVSPAQPASSPVVPTLNNSATTRASVPHASVSDYPFHAYGNYGYEANSPSSYNAAANLSPRGGELPPPVPGKIPIQTGREDWSVSSLSEEMRRIDIGVGDGQGGRSRRSRFGG